VQGIVFLLAGYETTAQTLGSLTYHLAKNPEVLDTLVREVDDVLETFQGRVDHETIADMVYLDACVKETLRLEMPSFISVYICFRRSTRSFSFNDVLHLSPISVNLIIHL